MLAEPGRYRINVFPDAKPYIYKTDIDFILKEDDQLNCQLLGRFIQTIFILWEKLKIEQSVFHELRDDIVVTNLETSIRQAERLATHFLRIYDKHSTLRLNGSSAALTANTRHASMCFATNAGMWVVWFSVRADRSDPPSKPAITRPRGHLYNRAAAGAGQQTFENFNDVNKDPRQC